MARAMAPLPLLLLLLLASTSAPAATAAVHVIRADRKVDLMTQVVRVSTAWKVENTGPEPVSELKLALSAAQAERMAFMEVVMKGKGKNTAVELPLVDISQENSITIYTLTLSKPLHQKETATLESYVALTHQLHPFPEEVTQSSPQLVKYDDNAYILSPYPVKMQTTYFKLSSPRVESFTKVGTTKVVDTEVRYGPYENMDALKSKPITLHFENNQPFAVVEELVREIEISHWGNVYVTENYKLANKGARLKGTFSRFEYQARPGAGGPSSFRHLHAKLPLNAHSVYYRDDIGNISTSHLRSDFRKTELELEPRYPLFGGWKAAFTLGYSVPLQDLVFKLPDGSRYLTISFGSPFNNVVVDKLVLKVVLPEGSYDMSVSVPFPVEQGQEKKYSYLDTVGRTVAVMVKQNSVLEHQFKFVQVHYRFNSLGMLVEPAMLILAFFAFFAACVAYTHFDFTLSRSTAAYLAQVQKEEVSDVLQRLQKVTAVLGQAEERLDTSLREVTRTGDVAACRAARKAAAAIWKEACKDLKTLSDALKPAPGKTSSVKSKVESLLHKEKEMVEKVQQKQTIIVDAYERKLSRKEIDSLVAPIQEKLESFMQEVSSLISSLDD